MLACLPACLPAPAERTRSVPACLPRSTTQRLAALPAPNTTLAPFLTLRPFKNADHAIAAAVAFGDIVAAYEVIGTPDKRAAFDEAAGQGDGSAEDFEANWESGKFSFDSDLYAGDKLITTLTEKLWDKRMTGDAIWLVEGYAAWCPACKSYVQVSLPLATPGDPVRTCPDSSWKIHSLAPVSSPRVPPHTRAHWAYGPVRRPAAHTRAASDALLQTHTHACAPLCLAAELARDGEAHRRGGP